MSDGNYPMIKRQCSKYFWRCSDGKTTRRVCRDELFFNTITGKCDMAKNVEDCIDKSLIFLIVPLQINSIEKIFQKKKKKIEIIHDYNWHLFPQIINLVLKCS